MADTPENDTVQVQHLGITLSTLIAGLVIHSFIIGVNVYDWWKGRSVTPVDHIVTSLGISRMCAQCAVTLYIFLSAFTLRNLYVHVTLTILDEAYCFFVYANIWLTSLLSIVFYLKISNLHTRLFLYLRRMILHRTGHFIVASLLLSALSCLKPLVKIINEGETHNTTMDDLLKECTNMNSIFSNIIGAFFPMLFYSTSSVLLFTSLYHHTTRMKMSNNLSINLETYYSLMRFVSFTLLYNTMYFIVDFVCAFYYYFYCVSLLWLYIFLGFLPILHSSYMIYRTAKLRTQMSKVLHNVIGFLFQRKNIATQENIEVVT